MLEHERYRSREVRESVDGSDSTDNSRRVRWLEVSYRFFLELLALKDAPPYLEYTEIEECPSDLRILRVMDSDHTATFKCLVESETFAPVQPWMTPPDWRPIAIRHWVYPEEAVSV